MNSMDILEALGDARARYVWDTQQVRSGAGQPSDKRLSTRKMWLIAAVIAMMLLLVGCAVVYVLRLQDMKIGEETITREGWHGPSGEYVPPTQWVNTELSLQGYNGSSAQLAMREWLDFQEQYDPDHSLMKANNHNESGVPEQYYLNYGCYTFEMVDRLNEILDKYQLKPLGTVLHFQYWEEPLFYEALQIGNLCRSDADADRMQGYFYPEGSFHTEFLQALEGEQDARIVAYTYAKNPYFYPYYSAVANVELWEQWHYTTADGTDVLLAAYENALVIICDCDDAFIHISTEKDMRNAPYDQTAEPMTRQEAERIADSFDYSIRPQPCDPAQVEAMREDFPMPEEKTKSFFYNGFRIAPDGSWFPPEEIADSFAHYISYVLDNTENPENLEYCVTDLDGNGEDEIILGWRDTGRLWEMIKMDNGLDTHGKEVSIRFINGYLYEGPVFAVISDNTEWDGFISYEYKDFSWNDLFCLRYDPETKVWTRSSGSGNTADAVWEAVSEYEVNRIQNQYKPVSLDMKPLSGYPLS